MFRKRQIFLPDEYDQARKVLAGRDVIVLGMNGYSSLKPAMLTRWGVPECAYEAACSQLLATVIKKMMDCYTGVDIRVVHGASDMGVDKAIITAALHMGRPQLGFNCPKWMFYVPDNDDFPVYVGESSDAYADRFIESLDVLIAANGRLQAFRHDIMAAFEKMKYVIPVNVMGSISTNGGPEAIGVDGHIEDAVTAFESRVFMVSQQLGYIPKQDAWKNSIDRACNVVEYICRNMLSPQRAFPLPR